MKKTIASISFPIFCFLSAAAQSDALKTVHIGLLYPLSTNGFAAPGCTNYLSVHAIAGVSGSEKAFCIAGVTNVIKRSSKGLVAASFSNHIGDSCKGIVAAGFLNTVGGTIKGVEAAGFMNMGQAVDGAQLAGFINTANRVKGIQAAGFLNTGKTNNVQLAGFGNIADTIKTIQIAGLINTAKEANIQIAGFINIAHKVKGAQIAGFINISDSCDYSLGLINIVKNGEKAFGITTDETGTGILAFRSGGRKIYGIIGGGYNLKKDVRLWAMEIGLGAYLFRYKAFTLKTEAVQTCLKDLDRGTYIKSAVRTMPSVRIHHIELFGGPSFNYTFSDAGNSQPLNNHYLWDNLDNKSFHALSIGYILGLQVHL